MDDVRQLYDKIDAILDDGKYAGDHRLFSRLCVDLCDQIAPFIDVDGMRALSIAKDFWAGKLGNQERLLGLALISPCLDTYVPGSPANATNRLLFGALYQDARLRTDVPIF